MKKWCWLFCAVVLLTSGGMAADFSLNLHVDYNHGVSDYFDQSVIFLTTEGKTFIETRDNRMGFGFALSVTVPVWKRFSLQPGIAYKYGHQNYEYRQADNDEAEPEKATHFFDLFAWNFSLVYDILRFRGDWNLNALLALGYNRFSADQEMREDERKYWSLRAGLGATFVQIEHFGFQMLCFYEFPLSDSDLTFLGISAGIMVRF